jgi:thioredoxin reductase (NADPH)
MDTNSFDTIIIGAGPAGLTAGTYLSRAKRKVLIIDTGMAGGQVILTHEVANYPGFESISGYTLSSNMKNQALRFGCEIKTNVRIKTYQLTEALKKVILENGTEYDAPTVIIASGGRSKKIGAIGEDIFAGRGISYCATCDGDFFQDKEIIVVGGGNSAVEEAVSLTKYASKITMVHILDQWQAFENAVVEMKNHPKIEYKLSTKILEFLGQDRVEKVKLQNVSTQEIYEMPIDGVFIFIGYTPNSEFIKEQVETNSRGEIVVNSHFKTSLNGVYAAGDCIEKTYRQITTAVSDGTQAALNILEFLNEKKS